MTDPTEDLDNDPSADDVNADNFGEASPIADKEADGMSPLSLPASASTEDELEAAYDEEVDS